MNTVVIGASGGIGGAVARALLRRGHSVWGTARDVDALPPGLTGRVRLDLREPDAPAALAAALPDAPIGLLVVASGIHARSPGVSTAHTWSLEGLTAAAVLDMVQVNAVAPVLAARGLAGRLRGGCVVLLTSRRGSLTMKQDGGNYGYCASKAALNMLGRALAHDLADQATRVLLVHPGVVRTPMGGPDAFLDPEDAAAALLDLVDRTDASHGGQFLEWDGQVHPW